MVLHTRWMPLPALAQEARSVVAAMDGRIISIPASLSAEVVTASIDPLSCMRALARTRRSRPRCGPQSAHAKIGVLAAEQRQSDSRLPGRPSLVNRGRRGQPNFRHWLLTAA